MYKETPNIIIVIPTYNNAATLPGVLDAALNTGYPVLVVNDGSTDSTEDILRSYPGIFVHSYSTNKGKGFALKTGLTLAKTKGFRYAVTLDSDGQHFPEDITVFTEEIARHPDSLLIGARNLDSENMPGKNTFANKFSNFWFRVETGIKLADTQSGYRLYPLERIRINTLRTSGYEFEVEVIVRAAWKGIRVANVPVRVYYPPAETRVSHFRPAQDFLRISLLNSVLVLISLFWYWPVRAIRALSPSHMKLLISKYVVHLPDSNLRIANAVGFGMFMGIVPIWGYQMLAALALAHLFRLNKVIVLIASNISIPPMIPFILFGSYALGGWVLNQPVTLTFHDMSLELFKDSLIQYITGSLLLALLAGLAGGILCYILLTLFKRKPQTVAS